MVGEIVRLCGLCPSAQILDAGCGCGRLARAFGSYLNSEGRYEGFDVARPLIDWCQQQLKPQLPNFNFSFVDIRARGHNPKGALSGTSFRFPFADKSFDCVIVSSVFTHLLPEEIENYATQISRVLRSDGSCFISMFLFDEEAEAAVAQGATIFDFRYPIGPCLTFDRERPDEGIACRKRWFVELLQRSGMRIDAVQLGNWRRVRSYKIYQDYIVARKL